MSYRGTVPPEDCGHGKPLVTAPSGEELPLYRKYYGMALEFDWGNTGPGAAQLAYAILRHHTGKHELSIYLHQCFKSEVIALLDSAPAPWAIEADRIERWIDRRMQP